MQNTWPPGEDSNGLRDNGNKKPRLGEAAGGFQELISSSRDAATKNGGGQERGDFLNEGVLGKRVIQRRLLERRKGEDSETVKERSTSPLSSFTQGRHWLGILTRHDKADF